MKRKGRLRRRLAAGLLAPVAIWGLLVTLMPTGWARDRLVRALEARTGRAVRLDRVALGPLGAVHLHGLALAERGDAEAPWAEVAEIRIEASPRALLSGRVEARHVLVRGLSLRVERAEGGDFVFRDLCCARPGSAGGGDDDAPGDGERVVRWTVADARVLVDDAPTGTRLALSAIGGEGTWTARRVEVTRLIGMANGGRVAVQAEIERTPEGPTFESVLHAEGVGVNEGLRSLRLLAPVLAGSEVGLAGRLDLDLYLRGNASGAESLRRTAVGQGALRIDPVVLERCVLVDELRGVLSLPGDARVGSVRGGFTVSGGRVATRDLTLSVAGLPLVLEGATEFSGRLDYRLRTESLAGVIPADLRAALDDLPLSIRDVLEVRVRGTPDDLEVTLDGLPPAVDEHGRPLSDRDRLRAVARRLRDRYFR
jgi:hypothetical protein